MNTCITFTQGGGVVESVGEGVMDYAPGDHVIPLYTPECGDCLFCKSPKTNLCVKIRSTQGEGLMPDNTSRSCMHVLRPMHSAMRTYMA